MAILQSGDLALEIVHSDFEHGWVSYDVGLLWKGESIVNDAILKRTTEYWASRGVGVIRASEDEACSLLPFLKRVLRTNESDYWAPTEPDISLTIITDGRFPDMPVPRDGELARPESGAGESGDADANANALSPDDWIRLLLSVDTYNFTDAIKYSGQGICIRLSVTRADLERFYYRLRVEYLRFRYDFAVDEQLELSHGSDYEAPEF
ncbi:hypothetical protein HPQ64_00835 [Rhizobiales bacterium]|uniref:hypothetical protein n=1 Tax=Hongsoonwoonella zoysiae TaxID=2821844 RepID=UPI00156091B2|nr:hypothetical protein [Hongsoonwoonella zoysiae]NRG16228.1 hypothetical protein [Hongsoonwoonella zoysiae]